MARLGKVPEFRDGLRVTDAETLEIARMVLVGKVNREIVSAINVHGALAVGLSGEDANLITAVARPGQLGFVGDVDVRRPLADRAPAGPGTRSRSWPPSAPTPPGRPTTSTPTPWPGRWPRRCRPRSSSSSPTSPVSGPIPTTPPHCCGRSRSTSSSRWWRRGRPRRG